MFSAYFAEVITQLIGKRNQMNNFLSQLFLNHFSLTVSIDPFSYQYLIKINSTWIGHDAVVEILLQNKADPNILNNDGDSALNLAVTTENVGAVDLLIRYGAAVNHPMPSKGRLTSLHIAATNGIYWFRL